MSVRFDGDTVALPEHGLVIHPVQLVLYDARKTPAAPGYRVFLLVRGPDGLLYWQPGEWQDGEGMFDRGWYFTGADLVRHIVSADFEVLMFCYEPPRPDLYSLKMWLTDEA